MRIPIEHIAVDSSLPDSGIYFEALEPRLLFSGSTESVVVEADAAETGQTPLSVDSAEDFTYIEAEQETSAYDVLDSASSEDLILSDAPS